MNEGEPPATIHNQFIDEHDPNQIICDQILEAVSLWRDVSILAQLAKNTALNAVTETKFGRADYRFKVLLHEGVKHAVHASDDRETKAVREFVANELNRVDDRGVEFCDTQTGTTLEVFGYDFELVPIIEPKSVEPPPS